MRLLLAIFQLPFWVFLTAAGGLFYLGELAHRDTSAKNQEMARALAGKPPETVDLADFSRAANTGLADEISVRGVINPDYNYELTKRRKGADKTRFMFVLFDAADPADSTVARAALVLTEDEKDTFVNDYYFENSAMVLRETDAVSVITVNGLDEGSPDLSSMVRDAFEEQNLTRSENFIYIEPFLEGRQAGLTPTMTADELRNIIRGVSLVVGLIGLAKFVLRRRKKPIRSEGAHDEAPAPSDASAPFVPTVPVQGNETNLAATDPKMAHEQPTPAKRRLPIKMLAIAALIAVTLYSGHFAYLAIALVITAYVFIARKTGKAVKGGLNRLCDALPGSKSDASILARVQKKADADTDTENAVTMLRSSAHENTRETVTDAALSGRPEVSVDPEASKARGALRLPFLNRGRTAASDPIATRVSDDTTARKRFSLPLPGRKRVNGDIPTQPKPRTPVIRKKEAFQAPVLFNPADARESDSISAKAQLLLARLKPAEGAPRALAGRPDPFERLASESRGNTAR